MFSQITPVLVSNTEFVLIGLASALTYLLRCVDADYQGWTKLHIFKVIELLLVLRVTLDHYSLHSTVLFRYPLFDQFLNQKIID